MPRPRYPEAPPWVDESSTPHSATPIDYPELEESDDDDDAGAAAGDSAEEALCAAARARARALALFALAGRQAQPPVHERRLRRRADPKRPQLSAAYKTRPARRRAIWPRSGA